MFKVGKWLRWVLAVSLLVGSIGLGTAPTTSRSDAAPPRSMSCPRVQQEDITLGGVGKLAAVGARTTPKISAYQAMKIADHGGDATLIVEKPASSCATLGLFTSAAFRLADGDSPRRRLQADRLVWIVSYVGVCVPLYGGLRPGGPAVTGCAGHAINDVIDANSGRPLQEFSIGDGTPLSLSLSD